MAETWNKLFKCDVELIEVKIDVDCRMAAGSFLSHHTLPCQSQQWTKPRSDPPPKPHNTFTQYFLARRETIL